MSEPYEEVIEGESAFRFPPDEWHEELCNRLHSAVSAALAGTTTIRLLSRRSLVELTPHTIIRPDLALVTIATGKLWLAVEVVNSEDHRADTVLKKQAYEESKIARLWMADPRYNNIEVYHGSQYGLALKHILAGRESLSDPLLPGLSITIADFFQRG